MEEEEFRLFSCDQEPTLDVAFDKKNCVHQISQLYQVETMTLDHGSFGVVFILKTYKEEDIVVKILQYDNKSIHELKIACLLNNAKTKIFTKIYGWTICNELPKKWAKLLQTKAENDSELMDMVDDFVSLKITKCFIFMSKNDAILVERRDSLTLHEKKAIFLVLLHGFWTTKDFLFSHNDLNDRNIMLKYRNGKNPITLSGTNIVIENMYWYPKIIDFGFSSINRERNSTDLLQIGYVFNKLDKEFKNIDLSKVKSIPDIWGLHRRWFETSSEDEDLKIIFNSVIDNDNTIIKCCICFNDANFKFHKTVDSYAFCGKLCSLRYKTLRKWLPLKKF